MTIIYANSILKATVLTLAFSSANVFAETDSNSMESYTTCAVYHRMLAGAYMRESQSPELANLETQKMHVFIANAKRVGPQSLSAEAIEQLFPGISKSSFKKAVAILYKARKISIGDDKRSINLVE